MKRLLNVESKGVRIVGICGMGGIGKTTLAEAVFNQICCNFESSSFLGNVREVSKEPRGLVSLQKQLLSDIVKQKIQSISSVTSGKSLINRRLRAKKVFIVLDDVDSVEQLEALAGGCDWFGEGSRIIITTRDEHVLNTHEVHEIYKLKGLNFGQSLQLFSMHAFRKDHPPKDHEKLTKDVAHTAKGLPLALKVLGSFLCDKDIPKEWISTLESLKKIHPEDIMKKLKISFDGLNEEEREVFLDIACFFIGSDKEEAINIWKGCGFFPEIRIKSLTHKSLVDISPENQLRMHDQLRDMARQIVRQEQLDEPGERSRLWIHDEVLDVLKHFTGTKKVKGLLLKFEEQATASEENCIYTEAFTAMSKLRLLCIDNVNLVGSFKHFPSELRWFCWKRCPLECLPTDLHLEKLVILDLSYSKITQVWNGPHQNKNIKILKLGNCSNLIETPDFSRLPSLVRLSLENCTQLGEVHNSLGLLQSLVLLNLAGCSNLTELPSSICKLKCIESLILSCCSILNKLPRDLGRMESLTMLLADKTGIEYLPESVGDLKRLRRLCLNGCESLRGLPDSYGRIKSSVELQLEVLQLAGCKLLHRLPVSIGFATNVTTLTLDRTSITELSNDIVLLEKLKTFSVRGCQKLQSLPELPSSLITLFADDCLSMERLSKVSNLTNLAELDLSRTSIRELPDALGSLKKLERFIVEGCEKLQSLPGLPSSLIQLSASECSSMERLPDMSKLTNMTEFSVWGCKKLSFLPELPSNLIYLYANGCSSMERLPDLSNLTNMTKFSLCHCQKLRSLPELPSSLIYLIAEDCSSMERLPDLSNLANMIGFKLSHCQKLQSLPELPSSLIKLLPEDCSSMERLPDLSNLTNMTEFKLSRCPKLQSLPELPSSLIKLYAEDCLSVERLPDLSNLTKLIEFKLSRCQKLQSLPELPSSLIELFAEDCSSMERLPDLSNLTNLMNLHVARTSITEVPNTVRLLKKLKRFDLTDCKKLRFLPELPSSLIELVSRGCSSLERLPDMLNLTNLTTLNFYKTSITELPDDVGSLVKLEELNVSKCRKLAKLPDAIGRLSNLRELYAIGCNLSEAGIPTSVGKLSSLRVLNLRDNNFYRLPATISDMPMLEIFILNNCTNLQSLPELPLSLQQLHADNCPSMEILPDLSNLKNLKNLYLRNCEKLVSIQGFEGLESLQFLDMNGCVSVESLPECPNSKERIIELNLSNCEKLAEIQGIEKMGSIHNLNLSGCSRIRADTLRKCLVHAGSRSHILRFPGNKIPDWFSPLEIRERKIKGELIRMVGPSRHSNGEQHQNKKNKMMGILLCFVFLNPREDLYTYITVNEARSLSTAINIGNMNGDQVCLLLFKVGQFEERDEISFTLKTLWGTDFAVKKAGMHVLYENEEEESDDNCTTTLLSTYERIADFFISSLYDDDDRGGGGESNNSSSSSSRNVRKRNKSLLLSDEDDGNLFTGKRKQRNRWISIPTPSLH